MSSNDTPDYNPYDLESALVSLFFVSIIVALCAALVLKFCFGLDNIFAAALLRVVEAAKAFFIR